MAYEISKKFEFDFAHRVPTQDINKQVCNICKNKCRRIHGHTGAIEIFLKSHDLDKTGMVTDYTNLKWFKNTIIDNYLDHKTIFSIPYDTLWKTFLLNKPKEINVDLHIFRPHENKIKVLSFRDIRKTIQFLENNTREYELITINARINRKPKNKKQLSLFMDDKTIEDYKYLLDSLVLVNNYTTAESLAKIFFINVHKFYTEYYNRKFNTNIQVSKVCFYETFNSSACYSA